MFVDKYIANITLFAGNFAPLGWAFCQGQLLPISEYTALFSLIGTTYGGDGESTFALPDLRGRVAVHAGQAPGLSMYLPGEQGGSETLPITSLNLPPHTHTFVSLTPAENVPGAPGASSNAGTVSDPANHVPAVTTGINNYNSAGTGNMAATHVVTNTVAAGSSEPFNNQSPVLALNYIIALEGIYPSRG